MAPGFLGTRASLFPDVLVVALFLVLPAFFYGVVLAKKSKTRAHAAVMGSVFSVLFVFVIAFTLWNHYYNTSKPPIVGTPFYDNFYLPFALFHVIIAVTGVLLGTFVTASAMLWRRPAGDGLAFETATKRKVHIVCGKIALGFFVLIAVTGVAIYYMRYVYDPNA